SSTPYFERRQIEKSGAFFVSAAAGYGSQGQGVSSYLCFSMMLSCPPALLARSAVREMIGDLFHI
ncbi:hypothetical protein, partial [Pseudomonas sp. 18173]|uniref:hypothetical protein n=1 Tax=Pseudomonas sp. 18173 TaxID=3390055 RepID=UPI003D1F16B6